MSSIRVLFLLAWGLALAWPVGAGEVPLLLKGTGGYFVLRLPPAVQSQTRAADLSDIQVLNARGEPMQFAWANEEPSAEITEQRREVAFFEAPRKASTVELAQHGGWILDTHAVQGVRLRLELTLPAATRGIYSLALDGSDNLQQWQTIQSVVQLLSLRHRGQRLHQTVVELDGVQARYLRLRPLPGSASPPLAGARVVSVMRQPGWQPLQWSAPIAAGECTTQACDYPLPRHLPLERLEIQLAEVNTLARLQLLGRPEQASQPDAVVSRHRPHGMRNKLRELRHKDRPTPNGPPSVWWEPLAETSVYWVQLPEGEAHSQALALQGGLYAQLRVQPVGGVIQLGARPPTLRVGSRPRTLVFLGRGPAPYRLAWGGATPIPAMPLAELMPSRREADPLPTDTVTVAPAVVQVPAAVASPVASAGSAGPLAGPSRVYWLWAVLLAALGLMGYMAWMLLNPANKASS